LRRAARIVITDDVPAPKAIALVDSGQLDYLPNDFSSSFAPGGPLDRQYGAASAEARAGRQRFFLHPQPMLDLIVFNARRPLFRDARLRRAVGLAIDRAALAPSFGDTPAARLVPAGFPGFGTSGVYPLGPDLVAARRLVGAKPRRAVLLGACVPQALAGLVRSELARVGIAVEIRLTQACPQGVAAAFSHADLLLGANLICGPCNRDPAQYFHDLLAHGVYGQPLDWNAPGFRSELARAALLRGRARVAAYQRLDDELARAAPVLVYGAFEYGEYFGARVGCKRFPAFSQGVDLGALCVSKK
jgi:ABC-type transport system substrate-binding protein